MICLFGYYRCVTLRHALCHGLYHVISRHSTVLLPTNLMLSRSVAVCVMWLSSCHVPCHVFVFSLRSRSYETSPWSRSICHVLYLWFSSLCWSPAHKIFIFVTAHTTSRSASHYFFALSRSCYHVTSLHFSLAFISVTHHICFSSLSRSCYHVTSLRFSPAFIFVTHRLCCHALLITWRYCNPTSFYFALSLPY